MTGEELLELTSCVADAECLRDVVKPYSFKDSQYLGNAVTCTLSNGQDYKDWIGDGLVFAMWKYMINHDLIITYNGLGFDYSLWGGSILYPEHVEAKTFFTKSMKGKTIDLAKDIQEALGVRVKMVDISVPTFGDHKEMDGGHAPEQWRNGKCFEVIQYCRGDIRRTYDIFVKACRGEELKVKTKEGHIRSFKFTPKIR